MVEPYVHTPPPPHTASWRGAVLIKHWDSFTFLGLNICVLDCETYLSYVVIKLSDVYVRECNRYKE
jgi:hypothetical protein